MRCERVLKKSHTHSLNSKRFGCSEITSKRFSLKVYVYLVRVCIAYDQEAWWLNTTDTRFRKRIGGHRILMEKIYVNLVNTCTASTSQELTSSVYHRVHLWEDPTDCHVSQEHLRFSNQMISSRGSWFPDKALSTHIVFYKIRVRLFATTLQAP